MPEYLETQVNKFIFKVAQDRVYNQDGIWGQYQDGLVRIGLSDFLQQRSGDIAFVEMRSEGTELAPGDLAGTIETIKVNLEIKSPIAGHIVRINPLMETAPETINLDPYGEGWMCEIKPTHWEADKQNLLEPRAYYNIMKQDAEKEVLH